jgi:serine/threonine protein kinase
MRHRCIPFTLLATNPEEEFLLPNLLDHSLGRYHILEQLGEGGMATVYKAFDTRLECDVAVKVISTRKFAPDAAERALKRFEREAKALARLTHPNIVGVSDYGEYEGSPYLVMEFLPGGNLKQYLHERGRIPWQDAARLLLPVARALEFAHSRGVIHRDVKPSNILLTESGQPMLTDFGVAKVLEEEATLDITGTSAAVGTPEYMAPEQTGKNIDHRVDIYALGIVFYEMITGRRPFEADTPLAVLVKQASEPLPRPSKFVPGLPDAVERVLLKALAKKPADRYADMAVFRDSLDTLLTTNGKVLKHNKLLFSEKPNSIPILHEEKRKPAENREGAAAPMADQKKMKISAVPAAGTSSADAEKTASAPVWRTRLERFWIPAAVISFACVVLVLVLAGLLFSGTHGVGPLGGIAGMSSSPTPSPTARLTRIPTVTLTRTLKPLLNLTDTPESTPTIVPNCISSISAAKGSYTVAIPIRDTYEDGYEDSLGFYLSGDANMNDWIGTGLDVVTGLVFTDINVPAGAMVTNSYIVFRGYGNHGQSAARITGFLEPDGEKFESDGSNRPTLRPATFSCIEWENTWTFQWQWIYTPRLNSIVQEIIDQPGWKKGNTIGFKISNTNGAGSAWSIVDFSGEKYAGDEGPGHSTTLYIKYTVA